LGLSEGLTPPICNNPRQNSSRFFSGVEPGEALPSVPVGGDRRREVQTREDDSNWQSIVSIRSMHCMQRSIQGACLIEEPANHIYSYKGVRG